MGRENYPPLAYTDLATASADGPGFVGNADKPWSIKILGKMVAKHLAQHPTQPDCFALDYRVSIAWNSNLISFHTSQAAASSGLHLQAARMMSPPSRGRLRPSLRA